MDNANANDGASHADTPPTPPLRCLSRGRRLAAFLIEALIWGVLSLPAVLPGAPGTIILAAVSVVHVLYRGYLVHRYGGVLGHLAVSARIVNHQDAQPASSGQAWGRALASMLDFLIIPAIVNCVMVLFRRDRRHLYDLMAGTVVVERPETIDAHENEPLVDTVQQST